MTAPRLILASASPRRRELLVRLGVVPDAVAPADIDETPYKSELPRDYARRMAREKALAAASDAAHVLAGDTVVAAGRRILPKAEDEATARRCLELLSGRRHTVLSAIALRAPDGTLREKMSETAVKFKRLSAEEIDAYIAGNGTARRAAMPFRARRRASSRGCRAAIRASWACRCMKRAFF